MQTTIEKPAMLIAGIACRTSNAPDAAPQDIPQLWGRFFSENIANKIVNKSSDEIIALYCDYEGDHTKPYTLLIGYPVSGQEAQAEGIVTKTIPASTFVRYVAKGEHPQTLIETWGQIWQTKLNRTFTGDYELYGPSFTSKNPQEVEVYIAVQS